MAVLGKRKAPEPAVSQEDANEIFRRHFESRFEPLEASKKKSRTDEEEESDDDDDEQSGDESEEEQEDEWGGLSDDEISDDDDDGGTFWNGSQAKMRLLTLQQKFTQSRSWTTRVLKHQIPRPCPSVSSKPSWYGIPER